MPSYPDEIYLTPYFKKIEYACQHCGELVYDPIFIWQLDMARRRAGIPFVINSGYRCAVHNANVGGSPNSSHLKGCAADLQCFNIYDRMVIVSALIDAGFRRIGINPHKNFIHVDNDGDKPECLWIYTGNGIK